MRIDSINPRINCILPLVVAGVAASTAGGIMGAMNKPGAEATVEPPYHAKVAGNLLSRQAFSDLKRKSWRDAVAEEQEQVGSYRQLTQSLIQQAVRPDAALGKLAFIRPGGSPEGAKGAQDIVGSAFARRLGERKYFMDAAAKYVQDPMQKQVTKTSVPTAEAIMPAVHGTISGLGAGYEAGTRANELSKYNTDQAILRGTKTASRQIVPEV